MLIVLGDIHTQIPQRARVREVMARAQQAALQEPGCLSFAFAERIDEPGRYIAVERWAGRAELERHFQSPAFKAYQSDIGDLLLRPSEVTMHEAEVSVAPQDSAPMDPRLAD